MLSKIKSVFSGGSSRLWAPSAPLASKLKEKKIKSLKKLKNITYNANLPIDILG